MENFPGRLFHSEPFRKHCLRQTLFSAWRKGAVTLKPVFLAPHCHTSLSAPCACLLLMTFQSKMLYLTHQARRVTFPQSTAQVHTAHNSTTTHHTAAATVTIIHSYVGLCTSGIVLSYLIIQEETTIKFHFTNHKTET